jgi:hypothetical protein
MQRTPWTARTFSFDFPEGWIYNIAERLRGTEGRLRTITSGLSKEQLIFKSNDEWCIQEHVGHLLDLEELHEGRIDDFINGKSTLRAADMTNRKTFEADHMTKDLQQILNEFSTARNRFISRLLALSDEVQSSKALHPRLKTPMRPVDVAYFTAEHDDHHLASIRMIRDRF